MLSRRNDRSLVMDTGDEEDPMMDHGLPHRAMFGPLSCNDSVDWAAACAPGTASSLASLVSAAAAAGEEKVVVPCGTCALADTTDGSQLEIPGGLTVQGKLHFPSNAKLTVRTTSVIVEGIFSTDPAAAGTTIPAADGSGVKIILYGQENVLFSPHMDNVMACEGNMTHPEPCDVGKRAFVVAGGKLDVRAIDPQCPTWVHLLDTSSTLPPPSLPSPYSAAARTLAYPGETKPVPNPTCPTSRVLADVNFKVGDDVHEHKYGGMGQILPTDPAASSTGDNAYFNSYNRPGMYDGLKFDVDGNCFVTLAQYIVTGRARLRRPGEHPACTVEGGSSTSRCLMVHVGSTLMGGMQGGQSKYIHDGEWFDFTFPLEPRSLSGSTITFKLSGPDAWDHIDVDWIKIEQVPDSATPPDSGDGCLDVLYDNGDHPDFRDSDAFGISTWPWVTKNAGDYMHVQSEPMEEGGAPDAELNYFYRMYRHVSVEGAGYKMTKTGRWHTKFRSPCFATGGVIYTLRMRWRYNSPTPNELKLKFQYKTYNGVWNDHIFTCPPSSDALGWVDCEVPFTMPDPANWADGYRFVSYINDAAPYPSYDMDDISWTRTYEPPAAPQNVLHVGQEAASCWGAGSELIVTSATTDQEDAHRNLVVESSDPAAGQIVLASSLPGHTTSAAADPDFPVEVALMDRNFELASEVGPADVTAGTDNALHGGHMMILHTPNVAQTLEGVEIDGFGQQGLLGRYPIHFHMCEAVEGSLISKNIVKESNQRGIVIHGSHNITISDNALVGVKGHGYFLEDGVEQHNFFLRNLGAQFYPVITLVPSGNLESDKEPSVFWMSNTVNTWEGNVAAGGKIGFWIEMDKGDIRGPSAGMHSYRRDLLPLTRFANNDAHSSSFCGFSAYPSQYMPEGDEAVLENFRAYRNVECGVLFHVNKNMRLMGGVMADNAHHQVWNQLSSEIAVENTAIHGARAVFREEMSMAGKSVRCEGDEIVDGVTYSVNGLWESIPGMTLKNVQFDDFDCGMNSIAIHAEPRRLESGNGNIYDSVTKFDGVTYGAAVPLTSRMRVCDAEAQGVHDIALEDVQGVHDPTGQNRPGFLVSDNDVMRALAGHGTGATCTSFDDGTPLSCLAYCADACLQTFNFKSNSVSQATAMEISDSSGTVITSISPVAPGALGNGDNQPHHTEASWPVSLPAGTYTATFKDAEGTVSFPDYVFPHQNTAPSCTKADSIVNIVKPGPTPGRCDELLKTGDFESGDSTGWKTIGDSLELVPGKDGSAYALKQSPRWAWNHMIVKYLDLSCLVAGDTYDVSVSYKIVTGADEEGVDCTVTGLCPHVSISPFKPNQKWIAVAYTDQATYDPNGWNTITGQYTIPSDVDTWTKVMLLFRDSGSSVVSGDFIIDDFTMTKVGAAATG